MYVITGATGNTGKPIALALLNAGEKVRIISRSKEKAAELKEKGAEVFIGETSDTKLVTTAFEGAKAAYVMIPPHINCSDYLEHQMSHINAIAKGIKQTKVKHVVTLSGLGAHMAAEVGVVVGLNRLETVFNQIADLNVLHLRPTYFMENTFLMLDLIKQAGIMGSPIKPDLAFPVIATKDVAEYAIKRLQKLDFEDKSIQHLLGQRNVTFIEIAQVFGKAIGKPGLPYVEVSPEDFEKSLLEMDASKSIADNFNEFFVALNAGKIAELAKYDKESTTPTTIEEFAQTFAYVYNNLSST